MEIIKIIKAYKKKRKMNSEQLSKKSGVALGTLTKLLSGATHEPKFSTVVALAKALDCEPEAFFDAKETDLLRSEVMNIFKRLDRRGQEVLLSVAKAELKFCSISRNDNVATRVQIAAREHELAKKDKIEFSVDFDDSILAAKNEDEV